MRNAIWAWNSAWAISMKCNLERRAITEHEISLNQNPIHLRIVFYNSQQQRIRRRTQIWHSTQNMVRSVCWSFRDRPGSNLRHSVAKTRDTANCRFDAFMMRQISFAATKSSSEFENANGIMSLGSVASRGNLAR